MHVDPRGSCYVGNMQRRAPDFCQESFKVAGRTTGERVCCKLWKNGFVWLREEVMLDFLVTGCSR